MLLGFGEGIVETPASGRFFQLLCIKILLAAWLEGDKPCCSPQEMICIERSYDMQS